jgi:hypothetical protein
LHISFNVSIKYGYAHYDLKNKAFLNTFNNSCYSHSASTHSVVKLYFYFDVPIRPERFLKSCNQSLPGMTHCSAPPLTFTIE